MVNKQTRRKQIKSKGAEKIHFCLPYVGYIKFYVNTFGYLKTNKKTFTITFKYLKEGFNTEVI